MVTINMGLMPPIVIGRKACLEKEEIEIKECVVSVNV
jgi:hypothetical protein